MTVKTQAGSSFFDSLAIPVHLGEGICDQVDPEVFFPRMGSPGRLAKSICDQCPVRRECLDWAMDQGELPGVYGGTTERERINMRTEIRKAREVA